jgi:hypothetical protein
LVGTCCTRFSAKLGCGEQVGHQMPASLVVRPVRLAVLMSSLWTPDGERPVRRPDSPADRSATAPSTQPSMQPSMPLSPPGLDDDYSDEFGDDMSEEELAQVTGELLSVPAAAIIANHCIGFFQLAALHLSQMPPNLAEASLAIDALGAVVDKVGNRLGEDGETLGEALGQIRLAFVQVKAAADAQS